jgi:hypothetical protein
MLVGLSFVSNMNTQELSFRSYNQAINLNSSVRQQTKDKESEKNRGRLQNKITAYMHNGKIV